MPSPQNLATEIPLVSQHSDRIVKALSSSSAGAGGWDGHAQVILYWVTDVEERHISYSIAAAKRLDVSSILKTLCSAPPISDWAGQKTKTMVIVIKFFGL
jgi:hypothetical protein